MFQEIEEKIAVVQLPENWPSQGHSSNLKQKTPNNNGMIMGQDSEGFPDYILTHVYESTQLS